MANEENENADINAAIRQAAGRNGSQAAANAFDGITTEDLQAQWLRFREKLGADHDVVREIGRELSQRGGHNVAGGMDGGQRGVDVSPEPDMNRMIREAAGRYVPPE